MEFNLRFDENIKDVFYAELSGDLDINTVEDFKTNFLGKYEDEEKDIVLDLKDLKYIDSTGIGAIMTIFNEAKKKENSLSIKNANSNVEKLFKITELDKLFNME